MKKYFIRSFIFVLFLNNSLSFAQKENTIFTLNGKAYDLENKIPIQFAQVALFA